MPTSIVVTLKEIGCRNSGDFFGGTNPYIWPMLLWVDNKVNAAFPPPGSFRTNLGWGMKRGQTAVIPPEVGVLTGSTDGELRAILLVVPLLERGNSSDDMMRAAFQAYCTELPKAVSDNLLKLSDPATRDEAVKTITDRVKNKVTDAAAGQVGWLGAISRALGNDADDGILDFAAAELDHSPPVFPLERPRPVFLGYAGTELLSYGDDGTPGNVSGPVTVSHDAWKWFKVLFGSANRVYAVDPQGQLLSFPDHGSSNNMPEATVVGFGGWLGFKFLFAGGDRIYAVDQQGRLLSYGDDGTPGNVSDPVVVGFGGWSGFKFLFAGGNRIYAVDQQGRLLSYGDNGQPGNVSDPVVVGFGGWGGFRFLFAAGNRIYAVDQQGQLLSYGDNGQPGNVSAPVVVGFGGWQALKQVFGGGTRIYALRDTDTPSIAYRIQGEFRRDFPPPVVHPVG